MRLFAVALLFAMFATDADAVAAPTRGTEATIPADPGAEDQRIGVAYDLIRNRKPTDAIAILDALISEMESRYPAKAETTYYSARSTTEAVLYSAGAMIVNAKKVIVTDRNWGDAYFLKGFALIDGNRPDEAIRWLDKAVTLSPRNAHYLNERAEWFKSRRDWDRAFREFQTALGATDFSDADVQIAERTRALRGMAFSRVEQRRLGEAKTYLDQALKLDPNDQKARSELEYIASLR